MSSSSSKRQQQQANTRDQAAAAAAEEKPARPRTPARPGGRTKQKKKKRALSPQRNPKEKARGGPRREVDPTGSYGKKVRAGRLRDETAGVNKTA